MSMQQVCVRLTKVVPHADRVVADEGFEQEPPTNSHNHENFLCLERLHAVRVRSWIRATRRELEGYESFFQLVKVAFHVVNIPIEALVFVAHAQSPKTLIESFENGA